MCHLSCIPKFPFGLCIYAACVVASGQASGQGANRQSPNDRAVGRAAAGANQDLVTEFAGKLKSQQHGILIVTRDDGTDIMVKPPDDLSKSVFEATAKPAFLRSGMLVRFSGTFNRAGVAQSPINRVELFQPVQGKVRANQRHLFLPGVYPEKSPADQSAGDVANCDVVGTLVNVDNAGLMSVRAGKIPVQIPLLPSTTFEIRYNNLSLAQVGDPVKVSGFYNPPDETKVVADTLIVSTDRVYGEPVDDQPTRKRTNRRKRGSPSETSNEGEPNGLPADSEGVEKQAVNPPAD